MPDLLVLACIDPYQEMSDPKKVWNLGQETPPEFFGDHDLIKSIKAYLETARVLGNGSFQEQTEGDEMYIKLGTFIGEVTLEKYPTLDVSDCESVVVLKIPEGVSNVKIFYARNGNEEVSFEIDGTTHYAEIVPWEDL